MPKYTILIAEDDDKLREGLTVSLASEDISAFSASSVSEAEGMLVSRGFDLLLLDGNFPDGNGIDLCRRLKDNASGKYGANSDIPVIFLTVNDMEIDIVSAFKSGAADHVTKPFSLMVLRERIKSALITYDAIRVSGQSAQDDVYADGAYEFNFSAYKYYANGSEVTLSTAEQKLLKILTANRDIIITREKFIDLMWSCDSDFIEDNALTVAIKRLRSKLGGDNIKTIYGLGYMWTSKSGKEG
jgi:Response regulators consisting of a CheY-like receiver domain and a winged-helix DNA-binding domain